jgi:hypothetical protein
MRFLNWLMTEIDNVNPKTKKNPYEEFYEFVSKMFENIYSESWMNERVFKNMSDEEKKEALMF